MICTPSESTTGAPLILPLVPRLTLPLVPLLSLHLDLLHELLTRLPLELMVGHHNALHPVDELLTLVH